LWVENRDLLIVSQLKKTLAKKKQKKKQKVWWPQKNLQLIISLLILVASLSLCEWNKNIPIVTRGLVALKAF